MLINTDKFVLLSFAGFLIIALSFKKSDKVNDPKILKSQIAVKLNTNILDSLFVVSEKTNSLDYDTTNIFERCWYNNRIFAYMKENKKSFHDSTIITLLDEDSSWCFPINQRIVSKFGYRGGNHFHKGLDVHLKVGQPVKALFKGKVRYAQFNKGGYGNLVIIRHNNGTETYYAHLSKLNVSANDIINAGDIIGLGGNTGASSGPHLHFELRVEDKAINPEYIFNLNDHSLVVNKLVLDESIFSPEGKKSCVSNHTHFANSEKNAITKKNIINKSKSISKFEAKKPVSKKETNKYIFKEESKVKKDIAKIILKPNLENTTIENNISPNNINLSDKSKVLYHTIEKGDCIFNLSRRYNVSVNSLYELNSLNERSILNIDQKIRIK